MSIDAALNKNELMILESFLRSDATPNDCMNTAELDGFLTGVAIGPELISVSEWLGVVWGRSGGPDFESVEHAQTIISLILRHLNGISDLFATSPHEICRLPESALNLSGLDAEQFWCCGFLKSVQLRPSAWDRIIEDGHVNWLTPLKTMTNAMGTPSLFEQGLRVTAAEVHPSQVSSSVINIHAYWLANRVESQINETKGDAISNAGQLSVRNRRSTCPCGSGRLFRYCCGDGERAIH